MYFQIFLKPIKLFHNLFQNLTKCFATAHNVAAKATFCSFLGCMLQLCIYFGAIQCCRFSKYGPCSSLCSPVATSVFVYCTEKRWSWISGHCFGDRDDDYSITPSVLCPFTHLTWFAASLPPSSILWPCYDLLSSPWCTSTKRGFCSLGRMETDSCDTAHSSC